MLRRFRFAAAFTILVVPALFLGPRALSAEAPHQGYRVVSQKGEDTLNHCRAACGDHYVAYAMENHAILGGQKDDHYLGTATEPANRSLRVFVNAGQLDGANLTRPAEARIEKENGAFAISTYRSEILKVGEMRKSETMILNTPSPEDGTVARVRMVFGDTLRISSQSLKNETPIKIVIHRKLGGFGGPVTDYAFYHGISQTMIDGKIIADLNFDLSRKPGPGNTDQIAGKDDLAYTLDTRVGDTLFIEGMLQVEDGVNSDGKTQQMLNGADSVLYTLSLPEGTDVCVTSASGLLSTGSCR
jgi:hypothetical protein